MKINLLLLSNENIVINFVDRSWYSGMTFGKLKMYSANSPRILIDNNIATLLYEFSNEN